MNEVVVLPVLDSSSRNKQTTNKQTNYKQTNKQVLLLLIRYNAERERGERREREEEREGERGHKRQ